LEEYKSSEVKISRKAAKESKDAEYSTFLFFAFLFIFFACQRQEELISEE
jgi:hypothetical protein